MSTNIVIKKIVKRACCILKTQGYKVRTGGVTKKSKRSKRDKPMPEEAKARMQWALDNAWADSTLEKYKYSVDTFINFCDKAGIPSKQGAPWKGGLRLQYTLNGVENLKPELLKHEEQLPITKEMINILDNPKDTVVSVAACSMFWGQICLDEMLSDTQSKYFLGRIPVGADLGPAATAAGT
ncbi:hypothetical protein DFH08DRAFT_965958 [Mycena albidolilacea]|uniref:Uncharacterized protein n=1 Tax=Mycena albidolilacea TaxID=1033008 RepID=A0AAD6ZR20_9AGAR|nr:hypothetical protein DFH08DRAFT_965958 [Mycena albidolilacea]